MDELRQLLLANSMAGQAQGALSGRDRQLQAAEAAALAAPGAQPPAMPSQPAQAAPGMSQAAFSGYGQQRSPQQRMEQQRKLMMLLQARQAEKMMGQNGGGLPAGQGMPPMSQP